MKFLRLVLIPALIVASGSAFAQSARPGLGSWPHPGGTTFRVWAPNAQSAAVAGEFNDWHAAPMARDADGGTWSLDVAGARPRERCRVVGGAARRAGLARHANTGVSTPSTLCSLGLVVVYCRWILPLSGNTMAAAAKAASAHS